MLVTRECDYAVRVVRALAGGERMPVAEICGAEHIPQPYAYKILKKLEKGGIVTGFRGPAGGYELAKPLGGITLYDIFTAVEDEIYLNSCLQDGFECPNNDGPGGCHVHEELRGIQQDLVNNLQNRNMADILAE